MQRLLIALLLFAAALAEAVKRQPQAEEAGGRGSALREAARTGRFQKAVG